MLQGIFSLFIRYSTNIHFRIMTNIYEAITINSVLRCHDNNKGYLKIWYLYILSLINLLMVVNASLNLPIYWCVGTSFKTVLSKYFKMCKINKQSSNTDKSKRAAPPPVDNSRPAITPEIATTVNTQLSTHHLWSLQQTWMALDKSNKKYCQAQFQLASSVEVQLRTEISLIISVRPTHPPVYLKHL